MSDDAESDSQFTPEELSRLERVKAEAKHGLRDEQKIDLSDQERVFGLLSSLKPHQIAPNKPKGPLSDNESAALLAAQRELRVARKKLKKMEPEGNLEGEDVNYIREEIKGFGNLAKLKMLADPEKVILNLVADNKGSGFANPQQEVKRHLSFRGSNLDLTLFLGGTPDGTIKAVYTYTRTLPISRSLQLVNTSILFNTGGECFINHKVKDYETGQKESYSYMFGKNNNVIEKKAVKIIDQVAGVLDQYNVLPND